MKQTKILAEWARKTFNLSRNRREFNQHCSSQT
jgi:hypothetical protein